MEALMARYQAGDANAFEALYRGVAPQLRRELLASGSDALHVDQLVEETFRQIHRARRTYNPRRPFLPWAHAIATHVLLANRARVARLELSVSFRKAV